MRYLPLILVLCLSGCPTAPSRTQEPSATRIESPVAYINGQPVRAAMLRPALYETAGGAVLADAVVDRMLIERLSQRGLVVTAEDLVAERELLLMTLDPNDEDQAARLLKELREARGLGDARYRGLLRRNAGLRKLVRDDGLPLTAEMIGQQYELRYGQRYQVRIITADALRDFVPIRQRLDAGEPFSDVAAEISTDLSAAQGGLLSPISPVDPTYPQTLRNLLPTLQSGQVSEPIAIDGSFALVKLEKKVEAKDVKLDDVREELIQEVRLRVEGMMMNQMGRALIREAKVTVLDPALGESWRRRKAALGQSP